MAKEFILNQRFSQQVEDYDEIIQVESDTIVVAVIIGFVLTRFYQNQPCQFDIEHPTDKKINSAEKQAEYLSEWQDFLNVLNALAEVIDRFEPGCGEWLRDGQSATGDEGALITGKAGGATSEPKSRATPNSYSKMAMINNAMSKRTTVYQGRGAYTGLVENPISANTNLYPTMRVSANTTERPWPGKDDNYWGLISPENNPKVNLSTNPAEGMGPLPTGTEKSVKIGYVHGMCTAISHCVDEGPWATPYEMTTGSSTTKLASCFPCTTFMYSSGYPPSSIHLGRGESWLPPRAGNRLEVNAARGNQLETHCDSAICSNLSKRWHREIYQQLSLGARVLMHERVEELIGAYDVLAAKILSSELKLYGKSSQTPAPQFDVETQGGSLFLSALSVHDSEVNRLKRCLQPAYATYNFATNYVLRDVGQKK